MTDEDIQIQVIDEDEVSINIEDTDSFNINISDGTPPTKLNDLTDVTVTSPTNEQILVYNSTTSIWENKDPSVIEDVTWSDITGDQSDINISGFTNDIGYLKLDQTTPQTTTGTFTFPEVDTYTLGLKEISGGYANQIVEMTSYNTPTGYVASASNELGGYVVWKAFRNQDPTDALGWATPWLSTDEYIQMQFPSAITAVKYSITTRNEGPWTNREPKSWKFEGSSDGSTWTTLDTQTDYADWAFMGNETKEFIFSNSTAYLYYRLTITDSTDASYVGVGNLKIYILSGTVTTTEHITLTNDLFNFDKGITSPSFTGSEITLDSTGTYNFDIIFGGMVGAENIYRPVSDTPAWAMMTVTENTDASYSDMGGMFFGTKAVNTDYSGPTHQYGVYGYTNAENQCFVGIMQTMAGGIQIFDYAYVGRATSFYSSISVESTAYVDNLIAFELSTDIEAGATIGNFYGLLLPNITQGTNNYAIKTGLGKVEFGDKVTAPHLDVGTSAKGTLRVQSTDEGNPDLSGITVWGNDYGYATWMGPSSFEGYLADTSTGGFSSWGPFWLNYYSDKGVGIGNFSEAQLSTYRLGVDGKTLFDNKICFTQTDGNEYIDSLNDGYMDYGATTQHRFNTPIKTTQFTLSALNTAPASATATGTLGEIRITATAIYVCTATNTWKKADLASW